MTQPIQYQIPGDQYLCLERAPVKYHKTASLRSFFHISEEDLQGGQCFLHVDMHDSNIDHHLIATVRRLNDLKIPQLVLLFEESPKVYFEKIAHPTLDFDQLRDQLIEKEKDWVKTYGFILKFFKGKLELRAWHFLTHHETFSSCLEEVVNEYESEQLFQEEVDTFVSTELEELGQQEEYQAGLEASRDDAISNLKDFAFETCASMLTLKRIRGEKKSIFSLSERRIIGPLEYFQKYKPRFFYDIRIFFQKNEPSEISLPESLSERLEGQKLFKMRSYPFNWELVASFFTCCNIKARDLMDSVCILYFPTNDERLEGLWGLRAVIYSLEKFGVSKVVFDLGNCYFSPFEQKWKTAVENDIKNPNIVMWNEIVDHDEYPACLQLVQQMYDDHSLFRLYVEDDEKAIGENKKGGNQDIRMLVFEKCAATLLRQKLYKGEKLTVFYFEPIWRSVEWLQQYYLGTSFNDVIVRFQEGEKKVLVNPKNALLMTSSRH